MSSVKNKKKDRTTSMVMGVLAGAVVSAYGFREGDAFLSWMLPLALVVLGAAWAWWPRPSERMPLREDA
jgi:hypothetical protein